MILFVFEVIATLAVIFIAYFKWSYQYWARRGVPMIVQPIIPFGNNPNLFKIERSVGEHFKYLYDNIRATGQRFGGLYQFATPCLMITDLDLLRHILTKDFNNFTDRGGFMNEKDDPLSAHLFSLGGQRWRYLRAKLSPTFTSGKMKQMFHTLLDCEQSLNDTMATYQQDEHNCGKDLNIKDILSKFTTDVIGSCAFGLECNSFKDDSAPFRVYGRKLFELPKMRRILFSLASAIPSLGRLLRIKLTPDDVTEFFTSIVKDTIIQRQKESIKRNDFFQLLMDLKKKTDDDDGLTIMQMVAQSLLFFLAGFETSSTTMTFVLYELARNQDIQEKVRREINDVLAKYDNKITYEALNDMKYMGNVIDETLRKYPPIPLVTRECVDNDYKIPDSDVIIEKGIKIFIPIYAIQMDPGIWENPEKFDPERFNDENKSKIHPYAHIPFGEGPRLCIGLWFGLMQTKVGLTSLLRSYKFTVSPKTHDPLIFKKTFITTADGDIWLDAHKI